MVRPGSDALRPAVRALMWAVALVLPASSFTRYWWRYCMPKRQITAELNSSRAIALEKPPPFFPINLLYHGVSACLFRGERNLTQDFMHAKQTLHHWAMPLSPPLTGGFFLSVAWEGGAAMLSDVTLISANLPDPHVFKQLSFSLSASLSSLTWSVFLLLW